MIPIFVLAFAHVLLTAILGFGGFLGLSQAMPVDQAAFISGSLAATLSLVFLSAVLLKKETA